MAKRLKRVDVRQSPSKVLLLFIEPTPYLLPLVKEIQDDPTLNCEIIFATQEKSQKWGADGASEKLQPLFQQNRRVRNLLAGLGLLWRILAGEYSAAHVAGWHEPVILAAMFCLALRRIPFSTESDSHEVESTSPLKTRIKRLLYPLLFRLPARFLPGGTRQARYLEQFGVPRERISIAFMTVDIESIRSVQLEQKEDWRRKHNIGIEDMVFLYVGRLEEHKGLRTLLDAFAKFGRNDKVHLVVAGEGPLLNWAQQFVASSSRPIHVLGRQTHRVVLQWMRAVDVLVVPSYREPWGLVINEAMACDLPVIVTTVVGAIDDLVIDRSNGLVVPPQDATALHAAMSTLAGNRTLRLEMARNSRERIAPWTIGREANVLISNLKLLCDIT